MKSILLVKTSSLGDVVHNLPVASDIRRAFPQAAIDWAVEENFAAIPAAHDAVRRVHRVAIRRWRRSLWRAATRQEIGACLAAVRREPYEAVIDTQGLLKSALIARAARGPRYGLDWESSREPLAVFYDRTFRVPWSEHAVERNRTLAATVLGYVCSPEVDYGIHTANARLEWLSEGSCAVLIHATSATPKLWPETRWIELGRYLAERGMRCIFPWGNDAERARSERLARAVKGGVVPPALSMQDVMAVLARAHAVVGLDTGLTHLAGALGAATVGIYCATDPAQTGLYGCRCAANVGGAGEMPETAIVIRALERLAP
ncbi:MAG: lipopolysaccharide heptosyltransferase I [Betaproteobacteria bacterium]